jgi:hypothetical protein
MEIIKRKWTKQEIASALGRALQEKKGLEELSADTTEVETKITEWRRRYDEFE